jgi:hypothetical protein
MSMSFIYLFFLHYCYCLLFVHYIYALCNSLHQVHYGEVNFVKFLPIFFEGVKEKRDPLKFLAQQGTLQLLEYIDAPTLIEALPAVMREIYGAFDTNDKDVICATLKSIQSLVLTHPEVGPELVSHKQEINKVIL